jgi:hypothetical protein
MIDFAEATVRAAADRKTRIETIHFRTASFIGTNRGGKDGHNKRPYF